MARTVRNPLELRTPVRTISSVMRNAPRQQFRPTQLDFGDGRPARGGNITSVTRAPRETISRGAPVAEGVATPISRGTTTTGVPAARVQTGTSRAPQASPKPAITSAIKKPAVAAKTTAPAVKPAATKTTTALKPVATKTPVAAKTTTKAPVAAKTTKTPVAAKTTTKPVTTTTKPAVTTTKPVTKPTSSLTSTLKNAAIGAGTAALINNLVKKPTTPTGSPTKTTVGTPPFVPPKTTVKPTGIPTAGGVGIKPGGGAPTLKPPTGAVKPPVTSKAATTGTTGALTEDQIQAELDRVKASEEANVVPEGAVTNADGSYSVTENGMTTTYAADGSIVGMEAATDTTVTGTDTSNMTDLGEGYFADADGNIYGADGNLMYTVGADGDYVDASTSTADATTWTDPDTGETWNLGADGNWSQEGISTADETSWTDPETGFTWNQGADGEWTQEGFDTLGEDTAVVDDALVDDYSDYVDDGTNYEEDAKGGSIPSKRYFDDGGSAYSDTTEEVQPWQNVDYNYGEEGDPTLTGYTLTGERNPVGNTYSSSMSPNVTGYIPSPEGWPDGYVDNGDGTATYVDEDGSTITIDADTNIVFTTDSEGNVFNSDRGESVSGNYPVQGVTSSGAGNKPSFLAQQSDRDESVSGRYDQPYQNQTGILDSLLSAVRDNPGLAGGAVGALIASLMDQAESGDSAGTRQPVDISELTSFNPRTTDFGAGMVGGRTGTGSPLVSYQDYAEGYGDETPDDRLYSDLGISGWLREPDMADYRDEGGNLTDQSGNLVDEYGYLMDDGSAPEEETAVEDAYEAEEEPAMAAGGATHYTFGRVMNPAENLGIGMKKGGLSQAHTVHSHHTNPVIDNRVDFRKGSAVNGAGDGQSDDIPAWLADGEYVMDAELVSMLGNGSNKAGAKILDKFREDVRAHKRSAPLGKIPPKAKSPLNYLKESMNG